MRTTRGVRAALALTAAIALAATAAGCGGNDDKGKNDKDSGSAATVKLPDLKGQNLQVVATWTGAEQHNFEKVLAEFDKRTGAKSTFQSTGDNVSNFLGPKIEGGQPPDVAFMPQVGVLQQFVDKGWIKPASADVVAQLQKNYSKGWQDLGAYKGKQYGVYFKVANKSLIWYNTEVFNNAGVSEPKTWDDFLKAAHTISDSGVTPVSIGGADGWTLTDWFENIYLSQAGPQKYDQLAKHEIKWTDASVKQALTTLGQLFGDSTLIGSAKKALQTEYPTSVDQIFANPPAAGMVYEGDFVASEIAASTKAKVGEDAKVFPFPSAGDPPVVSGGDAAVALKDTKASQALLTFLASPDAAKIWAAAGGFVSPNKSVDTSAYPDDVSRSIAEAVIGAGDSFRFDMSDQAPAAFGGTAGQGEWKDLQDFLADPKDVAGAQKQLEADAAKAYKD